MIELLTGEDILAMQHLTRWHMVRTRRHQSLAEHSASVAMLAFRLGTIADPKMSSETALILFDRALCHDAHEVEYGDIPAIAKDFLPEGFDEEMRGAFWKKRGGSWSTTSAEIKRLIDLADKLEAYLFYSLEGEDKELREKLWISVQKKVEGMSVKVKTFIWSLAANVFASTFTPQPDKKVDSHFSMFDRKTINTGMYGKFGGVTLGKDGTETREIDVVSEYPSNSVYANGVNPSDELLGPPKGEELAQIFKGPVLTRKQDRPPDVGVPRYPLEQPENLGPFDFNIYLNQLQDNIGRWADSVFPNRTAQSSLSKLVLEEIPEFLLNQEDPLEYADLLILVLDVAYQKKINVQAALAEKMQINRSRVWKINPKTGTWQHVDGLTSSSPETADIPSAKKE